MKTHCQICGAKLAQHDDPLCDECKIEALSTPSTHPADTSKDEEKKELRAHRYGKGYEVDRFNVGQVLEVIASRFSETDADFIRKFIDKWSAQAAIAEMLNFREIARKAFLVGRTQLMKTPDDGYYLTVDDYLSTLETEKEGIFIPCVSCLEKSDGEDFLCGKCRELTSIGTSK